MDIIYKGEDVPIGRVDLTVGCHESLEAVKDYHARCFYG